MQNKEKHRFAKKTIRKSIENNQFFISLLSLQETAFVLHKLAYQPFEISEMLAEFELYTNFNYNFLEYVRAKKVALKIGFNNINDCLHTAIAESHCDELYTFNKKDFERIKVSTKLNIRLF